MDWSSCQFVETIPGKVSGQPVIKGTRVPADVILSNYRSGSSVDEILENYPSVSREIVSALLIYFDPAPLKKAS